MDDRILDRIIQFLVTFGEEQGYAPSYREIAKALDISSLHTVHRALVTLRERGMVEFKDRYPRTLRVLYGASEQPIRGRPTA
jgi:SOS-response transcriptional repressor LexA